MTTLPAKPKTVLIGNFDLEDCAAQLGNVEANRLYTEDRMTGDEMRDMAHRLLAIAQVCMDHHEWQGEK